MALSAHVVQFVNQLGLLTFIDPSTGPQGPHGCSAFKLVPTSGWHNGQKIPHEVDLELKVQGYKKTSLEGVEYYLVPDDSSTNAPGTLSHYAQRTAVADLVNPPGGGVNRAAETFDEAKGYAAHTVSPDAVKKYVKSTDNWEEARKAAEELNDRVKRQVS